MILFGYDAALRYVMKNGAPFAGTKAVFGESIIFDLSEATRGRKIVMPLWRGDKRASTNYAMREAEWYMMKTRDPEYIIPFGSIWDKMRGEDGLVNSNYGYQVAENNDWAEVVESLLKKGVADVWIATPENVKHLYDTVCNNRITLRVHNTAEGMALSARVVTRSLDLVFGLPYDMFAAQGLMWMIADELGVKRLCTLEFDVVNMHIYERHFKNMVNLDPRSGAQWLAVNADSTAYLGSTAQIEEFEVSTPLKTPEYGFCRGLKQVEPKIVGLSDETEEMYQILKNDRTSRKAVRFINGRLTYASRVSDEGQEIVWWVSD